MFDIGFSKIAMIAIVALIVIGPEKLPRVARTVGTLLSKAQRYVNDVKAEVNRSMELDELRKIKTQVESVARDVEQTVQTHASDYQKEWSEVAKSVTSTGTSSSLESVDDEDAKDSTLEDASKHEVVTSVVPAYRNSRKNWRAKRSVVPHWYKSRNQVRKHVQSDAAQKARIKVKSES